MRFFYGLLAGAVVLAWLVALGAAGVVVVRLRRRGRLVRWWWLIWPWGLNGFCHEEDCYYEPEIYRVLQVGRMAGLLMIVLMMALVDLSRPLWWPEDYLFERGTGVHPVPLPRHGGR